MSHAVSTTSRLLAGCCLLGFVLAAPARAQDEVTPPGDPVAAEETGLADIVVTAQKRAENLQDVPISVSAIGGAAVERSQIPTIQGLSGTVPNTQINNFSNTPNSAVITIRGIGVIEPDPYAGNTVSIVYDGVPQFFSMGALVDLYDIERIEVLRGPQGTLFGANTTGGVVNVVTAQPTGEFGGKLQASYGNYDHLNVAGAIDFPIVPDVLAGKIAISHDERDGFFTNVVDGSDMGSRDVTIFRGYLKFTPSANFDATLIGEYVRGRNGAPVFQIGAAGAEVGPTPDPNDGAATQLYGPESLFVDPAIKGYPNPCPSRFQQCKSTGKLLSANDSVPDISNLNSYRATLQMNWSDTGIGDVTSITGYKKFQVFEFTDQDQGVLFLDDTRRNTKGWQFSQELRTSVAVRDFWNSTMGFFYLKTHYTHQHDFRINFIPGLPGFFQQNLQDQDNYSYSAFMQNYFDITDNLRAQAGIRYTYEKTHMIASTLSYLATDPSQYTFDCFKLCLPLGGPTPDKTESWSNVGWKLGLDYKVTPETLLYASWARGFKSGGFAGRIGIAEDIGPYDPEKVDTYEAGIKTDLFDRRLRFNLTGFYTDYKNIQIAQIYFLGTVQGNTILNAGSARIKGIELEASVLPIDGLQLDGSLSYLDAKYKQFIYTNPFTVSPANPTGIPQDLSGNRLQNAPEWSATAGFTFTQPIGPGEITAHMQYSYVASKFLSQIANDPRSRIQPTHLVDGNIDYKFGDDQKFSIGAWVRNLLDKRYIQSVFDNFSYGGLVSYQSPREYGVTAKVEF